MSIRKDHLEEANAFLASMREEFSKRFESSTEDCDVYALTMVHFPLSQMNP